MFGMAESVSRMTSVLTSMPRHLTRAAGAARGGDHPLSLPPAERAMRARQRDDVADQIAQEHGPATMQMGDRQHAALAVGERPPGRRIDRLEVVEVRAEVLRPRIFRALHQAALHLGERIARADLRPATMNRDAPGPCASPPAALPEPARPRSGRAARRRRPMPRRRPSSRKRRMKLGTPHSTVGRKRSISSSASTSELRTLNSELAAPVRPCATGNPPTMPERTTLRNAPVGKPASG